MTARPALAFACAHMTDERLWAHPLAALRGTHDATPFVFRDHDSLGDMADMARSVGAPGQFHQQTAMLARPATPAKTAMPAEEILRRLLALNRERAAAQGWA